LGVLVVGTYLWPLIPILIVLFALRGVWETYGRTGIRRGGAVMRGYIIGALILAVGLSWFGGRTADDGTVTVYPLVESQKYGREFFAPQTFLASAATQEVIERSQGVGVIALHQDWHYTCRVQTPKSWKCARSIADGWEEHVMDNGAYRYTHLALDGAVTIESGISWIQWRWGRFRHEWGLR
jgi:hypothetical protein